MELWLSKACGPQEQKQTEQAAQSPQLALAKNICFVLLLLQEPGLLRLHIITQYGSRLERLQILFSAFGFGLGDPTSIQLRAALTAGCWNHCRVTLCD